MANPSKDGLQNFTPADWDAFAGADNLGIGCPPQIGYVGDWIVIVTGDMLDAPAMRYAVQVFGEDNEGTITYNKQFTYLATALAVAKLMLDVGPQAVMIDIPFDRIC